MNTLVNEEQILKIQIPREMLLGLTRGEPKAFISFVKIFAPVFQKYMISWGGISPADAEQLWQDLCRKLVENLDRFSSGDSEYFIRWLFFVAKNMVIDHHRRLKNNRLLEGLFAQEKAYITPNEEVTQTHTMTIIRNCLFTQLSHEERELLKLKFWLHYPYREIAQEKHLSLSTVKSRILRALHKIEKYYRKQLQDIEVVNENKCE